ncbi:hypothetical protein ACLB2K_076593 [Fragaria x ananassa]
MGFFCEMKKVASKFHTLYLCSDDEFKSIFQHLDVLHKAEKSSWRSSIFIDDINNQLRVTLTSTFLKPLSFAHKRLLRRATSSAIGIWDRSKTCRS